MNCQITKKTMIMIALVLKKKINRQLLNLLHYKIPQLRLIKDLLHLKSQIAKFKAKDKMRKSINKLSSFYNKLKKKLKERREYNILHRKLKRCRKKELL